MAERKGNRAPPYSEAQTKAWLAWLARGMQQHGQTVFMVEQLQPSWLATSRERVVYTLGSRLIVGLLYGLIFGAIMLWYDRNSTVIGGTFVIGGFLTFGSIFGLSVGLLDVYLLAGGGDKRQGLRRQRSGSVSRVFASSGRFSWLHGALAF